MVFLTVKKSRGEQGFEEEEKEFLFLLCAVKAVWVVGKSLWLSWAGEEGVVGLRVVGRGRQSDLHSWRVGEWTPNKPNTFATFPQSCFTAISRMQGCSSLLLSTYWTG